jgi:hypothetical protein
MIYSEVDKSSQKQNDRNNIYQHKDILSNLCITTIHLSVIIFYFKTDQNSIILNEETLVCAYSIDILNISEIWL